MERQSTDDGDQVVSLLNPVDKHQVIHVRGPGAPTLYPTVHLAPKAKVRPTHRGPAWVARRLRASPPRRLRSGLQERTGPKSSRRRPPRALTGACCLLAQLCAFSSTSIVSSNTIRARRNSYGESRISHRSLGFVVPGGRSPGSKALKAQSHRVQPETARTAHFLCHHWALRAVGPFQPF